MKIKFGSLVVDGRGKIGGHVASKNRGGAYLRTKVTPVNPQTAAQIAIRALLTALSQAWRTLTAANRDAWNAAVESFKSTNVFGDIKTPSGLNLFIQLNSNIVNAGGVQITSPPAPSAAPEYPDFTVTAAQTGQTMSVAWSNGAIPANIAWVAEATPQISQGKNFVKNLFRKIAVLPSADTTPTSIATEYIDKFGALVAGSKVVVRIFAVNTLTGVKSLATVSEITVGA